MIKILQYHIGNIKGGVENYVRQNYRFIDKNSFQFDFLTYDDKKLDFEDEFKNLGARFYRIPNKLNYIGYILFFRKIRKESGAEILHLNLSWCSFYILLAAKFSGFKRIVLHSHSSSIERDNKKLRKRKTITHNIFKQFLPYIATDFLACSELAAKWMFPKSILKNKRYKIAKNAIDLDKFVYNQTVRNQKRYELKIDDECFMVGHIGRFCYPKNHEFLIKIFNEIVKENPNSKLLLIGGYTEKDRYIFEKMQNLVKNLNLENKVIFLGTRDDISELLQIMDCFVLPSLFEGLPITAIEAQTSGLPSFFADTITTEIGISNLANFISSNETPKFWAEEILKCINQKRFSPVEEIRNAGYDIKEEVKNMEKFYKEILEK